MRLFLDQIIKEMPAEHTYYQDCVNELILVFREANDVEETRKEYTPDPVVIAHNLQVFTLLYIFWDTRPYVSVHQKLGSCLSISLLHFSITAD